MAFDQVHVRVGEQRAHDPGDEVGGELAQVGVDEADDVPAGDQQRTPQHLALARHGGDAGRIASRCTTRAPAAAATSAVRSLDPESTTTTSSTSGTRSTSSRRITATMSPTVASSSRAGSTTLTDCPVACLADRRCWTGRSGGRPGARVQPALDFFQHVPGLLCDPTRGADDYLNRPGLRLQS